MSEVTVSAKDKKKSKTDRDRSSDVRSSVDKDAEDLERAIRKSQKEERRISKEDVKGGCQRRRPWRNPGWRPNFRRESLKPSPLHRLKD